MIVQALRDAPDRRAMPQGVGALRRLLGTWGGLPTAAGPVVSEATALTLGAVFACVRTYSHLIAHLPLKLYQRRPGGGRVEVSDHPLSRGVLHGPRMNSRVTSFDARAFVASQVLLRGNSLAFVERNGNGQAMRLWPLRWDRVRVDEDPATRTLVYHWTPTEGSAETFRQSEVWHARGLTQDGVLGISAVAACRELFGIALASQEYAARFYSNGGTPVGLLTHPATLGADDDTRDAAVRRIRSQVEENYQGAEAAHRWLILEEGMKFEALSFKPSETQLLETRRFAREEIASVFGLPPHLIGHLERATFSNIEQQSLDFVQKYLTPFLVLLEQGLEKALLSPGELDRGFYLKHSVDALLRGDNKSRAAYFRAAIQTPWMTVDEVRELEELPPIGGEAADLHFPLNVSTEAGGDPDLEAEPAEEDDPEGAPDDDELARALPAPPVRRALPAPRDLEAEAAEGARAFEPVLEDAARRLLRAEVRQWRKRLERDQDLDAAELERFYAVDSEWEKLAVRTLEPALAGLGRFVYRRCHPEAEAAPGAYLGALVGAAVARAAGASRRELAQALEAAEDQAAARRAAAALFARWVDDRCTRAGAAAAGEALEAARAAARAALAAQ